MGDKNRRIILARHGETEANRARCFGVSEDISLTETGKRQAHELADRLAQRFRPDLLLSSAYQRARETSEIVGRKIQLTPEVLQGIHERHFGCLRGQPYEAIGKLMLADPQYRPEENWKWTPEGGESQEEVRLRVAGALDELLGREFREAVIVCHGAVIQAFCAHTTGEWRDSFIPPNCGFVMSSHGPEGWGPPVIDGQWDNL